MQSHSINENSFPNINVPSLNNKENNLINDILSDSNNSISEFEQEIVNQDKTEPSNKSNLNCNNLTNIFFNLKKKDSGRTINKRRPKYEIKKEDLSVPLFHSHFIKIKKGEEPLKLSKRVILL